MDVAAGEVLVLHQLQVVLAAIKFEFGFPLELQEEE